MAKSRFESAYLTLKADIVAGRYAPHQRLIETELAAALHVSRITLRAAFIKLHEDGMVELEPNRGARVRSLSTAQLVLAMQVRTMLKTLAAASAAQNATATDIRDLRRLLLKMEQAKDGKDYVKQTRAFDDRIVAVARNPYLSDALERLSYPIVRAHYNESLSPGAREQVCAESRGILGAI
ncbi:MAG: GntR family transcriptional regulator, partial [Chloroflexi bacterium]|nr:GntR family transcriptional regulator [Chloroflexota bacterium]